MISYDGLKFPKPPSRFSEKQRKRAEEAREMREVYAKVTARDHSACRVCGRFQSPRAVGMLERLHHHHVQYRSQGGPTTTANVVCLCSACHAAIHDANLRVTGDADLRDAHGYLCGLVIERRTESGWQTERTT